MINNVQIDRPKIFYWKCLTSNFNKSLTQFMGLLYKSVFFN